MQKPADPIGNDGVFSRPFPAVNSAQWTLNFTRLLSRKWGLIVAWTGKKMFCIFSRFSWLSGTLVYVCIAISQNSVTFSHLERKKAPRLQLERDIMQTTKLIFLVMIGLAMIDFSIAQSLDAAVAAKASQPSLAATKSTAKPERSAKSMQGVAAVYADKFVGRKTSSGQRFQQTGLTAAHRSLPLGTKVLVTNLRTRKSVEVRINDRGPWHKNRVIDLSGAAAAKVGMKKTGTALVRLEIITESSVSKS
jgi:rare lipoprotein A